MAEWFKTLDFGSELEIAREVETWPRMAYRTYHLAQLRNLYHALKVKSPEHVTLLIREVQTWPRMAYRTYHLAQLRNLYHALKVKSPEHAGVYFINRLPNPIKNASTSKVLKTSIKLYLVPNAFSVLVSFWHSTGRPRDEKLTPAPKVGATDME
ncbi:hypothetical protein J6590_006408 [Homalodisca vitripennis]|nr:hypothetical protein J6590_006408 [Homalodisca vitripennis]